MPAGWWINKNRKMTDLNKSLPQDEIVTAVEEKQEQCRSSGQQL